MSQQYLGSAEEVAAKLSGVGAGIPACTRQKAFADLAAAWSVLERLNVIDVVDRVVPRRSDAAVSVGSYITWPHAGDFLMATDSGNGTWS